MIAAYRWTEDREDKHVLTKVTDPSEQLEFPKSLYLWENYRIGDIFGIDFCSGSDKIFRLLLPSQRKENHELLQNKNT